MDEARTESWWSPDEGFRVIDAMTADAASRRLALAPEEGAWWWMTHASMHDGDAREIQISRLRSGLDLLIVEARVRLRARARPRPRA